MTLALTCALCLAGAEPLAQPPTLAVAGATRWELSLSLASAAALPPDLRLADPGSGSGLGRDGLANHERESKDEGGDGGQEGHGVWMGTTMIVVMVVMMVGLGAYMMSRGSFHAAPSPSPATVALPVAAPTSFSPPIGRPW